MSTVFKCLSKGAVDFLVKPIRKNELKNLWQHVWRQRCHSVSCSWSGLNIVSSLTLFMFLWVKLYNYSNKSLLIWNSVQW
jgi:hypothetical protein